MSGSAYSSLRPRPRKFVDAYVRLGVATEAYREAYALNGKEPKRPDVSAAKLMRRPAVREAIAERTEQAVARAGVRNLRVLEELSAIAFLDPGELFNDDNSLRAIKELPEKVRRAILALEVDELFDGQGGDRERVGVTRKVKLQPKIEALKLLGQYLKLFVERHEHTGKDGGPIETKELSDLDRARRVAFLLAQGLREASAAGVPDPGNPAGDSPPSTKQSAGDDQ